MPADYRTKVYILKGTKDKKIKNIFEFIDNALLFGTDFWEKKDFVTESLVRKKSVEPLQEFEVTVTVIRNKYSGKRKKECIV